MIEGHPYSPIFLTLLAIVFLGIISYMFLYNRRSRKAEKSIESHGHHLSSKEEGILEAQDAMRHEKREHHRH